MSITSKLSFVALLGLLCMPAHADWELNNADSNFYFVTSKAAIISEINSFANLTGRISSSGNAILEIDLVSVDTAIDIRNQRVRDMLFETQKFPTATISIDIDPAGLSNMAAGTSVIVAENYNLSLHGIVAELTTNLRVTKTSSSRIEVQPAQPIIVGAGQFNLTAGVEALREVAGLPSINPNVVVDFFLVYENDM
ncbi:MAG: YceI family protein [Pseudohongiellaceae bacterium]